MATTILVPYLTMIWVVHVEYRGPSRVWDSFKGLKDDWGSRKVGLGLMLGGVSLGCCPGAEHELR